MTMMIWEETAYPVINTEWVKSSPVWKSVRLGKNNESSGSNNNNHGEDKVRRYYGAADDDDDCGGAFSFYVWVRVVDFLYHDIMMMMMARK